MAFNRLMMLCLVGAGSLAVMAASYTKRAVVGSVQTAQSSVRPRLPDAIVPDIVSLCGKRVAEVARDGRLLNHFRYTPVSPANLSHPPALAGGNCQAINRDMAADFNALLGAARRALGPNLYAISCHRSEPYQADLFCGARSRGIPPEQRAETVAPPGFSEHHTGFAVDFGAGSVPKCNFQQCFGGTSVGRWLIANAASYGFEMSFPPGNAQGVNPEPWHWRWVGRGGSATEMSARQVFQTARTRFPPGFRSGPASVSGAGAAR
jgi:zinc D-Ala-D-Ala carboxypeptidase